jgi:hypothetical protein
MKSTTLVIAMLCALLAFGLFLVNSPDVFAKNRPASGAAQAADVVGEGISAEHGEANIEPAREVVLDSLPQLAPSARPSREAPDHPEVEEMEGEGKLHAIPGETGAPSPQAITLQARTPGASAFPGETESACHFFPSDHALATSSTYVVQVVNSCIAVFNTSGTIFSGYPKDLSTFFGAPSSDNLTDVRALYDWRLNRFIIVVEDFTTNKFYLGISKTANPTAGWFTYNLDATVGGQLPGGADFPMMGQTMQENGDADGAVYLSYDRFNASSGKFQDNIVWILPKTQLYAGAGFSFHFFFNLQTSGKTVDHVQPANVMSREDRPRAEFLINTLDFNFGCNSSTPCKGLVVWAIYNGVPPSGASPTLSGAVISTANSYIYPVTAAQKGAASGTKCAINTGNAGITGTVHWSAGSLFLAASTAAHNGQATDGFIYWQVHPYLMSNTSGAAVLASPAATIQNEICWGCNGFTGDTTYSEYYPAVQPDDEGNVTVVFNQSASTQFPTVGYLSQRTTQPTGTFHDGGFVMTSGQAQACELDSVGRNRWGDYSATSPFGTPIATAPTFWFAGSFSDSTGHWATTIGKNGYTTNTQP